MDKLNFYYMLVVCFILGICKSNPCKNGGSCVTKNGKEICTCLSGLTGATCEIRMHLLSKI